EAPDFTADTTEGKIRFHEWIGDKWAILFSHPKDFTPVCTTELGYMAKLKPEFDKRNTKIIGLSIDPVSDHQRWVNDIKETQGTAINYPMIGDADLHVAKLYDMIHPNASGGKRTAADNATIRSVFMIGPDKKVKAMLVYPMSAGRNFDEVLRLLDSLQLNAKHTVATPVNWKPGQDVIIPTSVSDEDAKKKYPQGFKTLKPYLRTVAQPKYPATEETHAAHRDDPRHALSGHGGRTDRRMQEPTHSGGDGRLRLWPAPGELRETHPGLPLAQASRPRHRDRRVQGRAQAALPAGNVAASAPIRLGSLRVDQRQEYARRVRRPLPDGVFHP